MRNTIEISGGSKRSWVAIVALLVASAALVAPVTAATSATGDSSAADGGGPTVHTSWYDVVDENTIVAAANLTALGDASTGDVRLEYRRNGTDDAWTATPSEPVDSTGEVVLEVTGLEPSTEYEYRAVAETAAGTDRGEPRTFETPYDRPEVTTEGAVEVNARTATLSANLTDLGDRSEAEVWFSYEPVDSNAWMSEWSETEPQTVGSTGTVTQTVTGLEPDTEYDVRASVRNDRGYGYSGGTEQFATHAPFSVATGSAANVSQTNALLTGTVESIDETTEATVRFEYGSTATDETTTTEPVTKTATGYVEAPVTDLEPETEYTFRLVGETAAGDADAGSFETFATPGDFAVETGSATAVAEREATVTGEIVAFGGSDSVTTWFEYRPTTADDWRTTATVAPDSAGQLETTIDDLEPGTAYEFRVVGEADHGDAGVDADVGGVRTFETAVDPVVETGAATAVDEESATVAGTLSDLGGADEATVSLEYRAAGADEWIVAESESLTEPGTLETTLSGLEPETTYEYRAVARADGVTAVGQAQTLTTEAAEHAPTVESLSGSDDSSPNPHAELSVDWRVADEDGDLAAVTVTIEDAAGQIIAGTDEQVAGTDARGSLRESVKHGDGETYTVTLAVEDDAGNVATDRITIVA